MYILFKLMRNYHSLYWVRLANGFRLWQFKLFSFDIENLNWTIWTKNLNCCLGQIILFENIIWIVVWVDVKCVILSYKNNDWNVKSKNTIQNGFKLLKFEGGKNLILKGLNDLFSIWILSKKIIKFIYQITEQMT